MLKQIRAAISIIIIIVVLFSNVLGIDGRTTAADNGGTGLLPPAVTSNAASDVTDNAATLNGNLDSLGDYSSANVSFEWGTASGALDQETISENVTSTGAFSAGLTNLSSSTNYYFRAKAVADGVTVYGDELSFAAISNKLVSIVITPKDPAIALGRNQQFGVTGTYSDSSTSNLTNLVTWSSEDTNVATINATGLARGLAEGQTTIIATLGGKSDNTTLTVDLPFIKQPAAKGHKDGLELPEKEPPKKGHHKLDSKLNRLISAQVSEIVTFTQESNIELVNGNNVRVIVETLPGQVNVATQAASALGFIETRYHDLLQVTIPIQQLMALSDNPGIRFVRLPWFPLPADVVVSEGVELIQADEWQAASYNGTGVKVGILDGGFKDYTTRRDEGELPATIATFWAPSIAGPGSSTHGTTCAEIVYDIAPDAEFYFANFNSGVEFGNAVDWFIANDVDIISCSMGWPIGGPGDGTGFYNQIIDEARTAGILWSQSMGNQAERHWQGDFVSTESPDPDEWHEFDPGVDDSNKLYRYGSDNVSGMMIIALKWNDTWGASANDYNLYLYKSGVTDPVASSTTIQNGNDNPVEGFAYMADWGFYSVKISSNNATDTVNFHLYSYYHELQYQVASSSLIVPADSPDAMSLGAVFWNNPTTLEAFSSQGPTSDNRTKPDLVAPDGVSTATRGASNGLGASSNGTGFFGTSASAPHAAGAAVLVKERYPAYTPAQIQAFLEGRAVDLGIDGKDNVYGSGRLDLGSIPGYPAVSTDAASAITDTTARLNGDLTDLGTASSVNVTFEWDTDTGAPYANETTIEAKGGTGTYYFDLSSLSDNTTYYFRAKAVGDGTSYGSELSFTTVLPAAPAPPPSDDGGGGGPAGGGGATDDTRITAFGDIIRESGEIWEDIVALSLDAKLSLDIPTGTFAKNRADAALYSIQVKTLAEPPEVPDNMKVVGAVYELLPDGAKFDPPITLAIRYDTSEIPEGMSESNLYIAKWIESSQEWIELESTVDPDSQTVTAKISGFSIHTVMARPQPASFSLTDLTINPESVVLGGDIIVSILLENTGDLTGSYEVNLIINDVQAQSQEITLNGSDSEQVIFNVTPEAAGTYVVSIGGLTRLCEVILPTAPPTPAVAVTLPPNHVLASFTISDLSITPSEVKPTEPVTISTVVDNSGGVEGSYAVVLEINGTEEARKEVTLGADKSETVTFATAKDREGSYAVNINGKAGQFIVINPAPPTPASAKVPSLQPPINSGLIGSIIAGCVVFVVGLLTYFSVWRKRAALRPSVDRRKQKRVKVGSIYSFFLRWRL